MGHDPAEGMGLFPVGTGKLASRRYAGLAKAGRSLVALDAHRFFRGTAWLGVLTGDYEGGFSMREGAEWHERHSPLARAVRPSRATLLKRDLSEKNDSSSFSSLFDSVSVKMGLSAY